MMLFMNDNGGVKHIRPCRVKRSECREGKGGEPSQETHEILIMSKCLRG